MIPILSIMREAFLHHVWKLKNFQHNNLLTFHGSPIEIIQFGKLNHDAGPDFYQAEIVIGQQLWVGCVEMHVNSSDWDLHQHSTDKAYQNVILHVVWNHDKEIDFLRQRNVETLVLKDFVPKEIVFNYQQILQHSTHQLACQNLIQSVNWDKIDFFFDRLIVDRLEEKSKHVIQVYEKANHNWEEVTFKLIASNFGLKVNTSAFENWSNSFSFQVLQKIQSNPLYVESLFFGQAGFLENVVDEYGKELKSTYHFIQHKFKLHPLDKSIFKFSSLRPYGFPTIRLAQLAAIYCLEKNLFSKIIAFNSVKEIEEFFTQFVPSHYWETHFVFDKESKASSKKISQSKIHNLIINTIIPLRFAYDLTLDKIDADVLITLLDELKLETNSIVEMFLNANFPLSTAKDSQAVLHLKKYYCDEKKCLNCAIGNEVLKP